jgi:Fe-S oxidoreductase
MLAQQNVETLNEARVKKVVASCPHCFKTISRKYPQLGGNYEVIHHTQFLTASSRKASSPRSARWRRRSRTTTRASSASTRSTRPRAIIGAVHGTTTEEMHRCKRNGFCCGADGARMWLEARTVKRINTERIDEALALDRDTVSTAVPLLYGHARRRR